MLIIEAQCWRLEYLEHRNELRRIFAMGPACPLHTFCDSTPWKKYIVTGRCAGSTYAPIGEVKESRGPVVESCSRFPQLQSLAACASLCNDSSLYFNPGKPGRLQVHTSCSLLTPLLVNVNVMFAILKTCDVASLCSNVGCRLANARRYVRIRHDQSLHWLLLTSVRLLAAQNLATSVLFSIQI